MKLTEFQRYLLEGDAGNDPLTEEQKQAVTWPVDESLLLVAGAGTGKTKTLITRAAWIATCGIPLDRILCLTFTNKAAAELSRRIRKLFLGDEDENQEDPTTDPTDLPDPEALINPILPVTGTFHAFCAKFLREHIQEINDLTGRSLSDQFTILDQDDQLRAIKDASLDLLPEEAREQGLKIVPDDAKQIQEAIGRDSCDHVTRDDLIENLTQMERVVGFRKPRQKDEEISFHRPAGDLVQAYENWKERNGSCDYQDLIALTVRSLERDITLAPGYRYVLTDEYQDTDQVQERLLHLLRKSPEGLGDAPLTAVGDDAQLLYAWRGACVENILTLDRRIGCQVLHLTQNFRSPQEILDAANQALTENPNRRESSLRSYNQRSLGHPVPVRIFDDPKEESMWIVEDIQEKIKNGAKASDFAVLTRTSHAFLSIDTTMARTGIPYRIVGGRSFARRMEVLDAAAWLRLLLNPSDNLACEKALTRPKRGIGPKSMEKIRDSARELGQPMVDRLIPFAEDRTLTGKIFERAKEGARSAHMIYQTLTQLADRRAQPREILQQILMMTGIQDNINEEALANDPHEAEIAKQRKQRLEGLIDIADDHRTLSSLCDHLALTESTSRAHDIRIAGPAGIPGHASSHDLTTNSNTNNDVATIATVHAAKGLEWKHVYIAVCEDGVIPSAKAAPAIRAQTAAQTMEEITKQQADQPGLEEERRILHVAITRAQESLTITRSKFRDNQARHPSRFLEELGDTVEHIEMEPMLASAPKRDISEETRIDPDDQITVF